MHIPSTQDLAAAVGVVTGIIAICRADFIFRWLRSHRAMVNLVKSMEERHAKDAGTIADLLRAGEAGVVTVDLNEGLLRSLHGKVAQLAEDLAQTKNDLAQMTANLASMTTKFAEGIAYICTVVAMHEPGTALPELPASIKPDVLSELEKRRTVIQESP
jgi:hypothetical protein